MTFLPAGDSGARHAEKGRETIQHGADPAAAAAAATRAAAAAVSLLEDSGPVRQQSTFDGAVPSPSSSPGHKEFYCYLRSVENLSN